MPESHGLVLTELEFEQLPPALRRKYFSSLERLRLAHHGAHPPQSSHDRPRSRTPYSSSRFTRRPSSSLEDHFSRLTSSTRTRLKKSCKLAGHARSASQQAVAQFAALPATLQRKHFSREDQILLASRINTVILDAADEAVIKQIELDYLQRTRTPTSQPRISRAELSESDEDSSDDDMQFSEKELDSFRWLDEPQTLDLSLYDYHAAVAETVAVPSAAPEKQRSRRSLSISSVTFNKRSSSRKSLTNRISLPPSQSQSKSILSVIPTQGHKRNQLSSSSIEPAATHYQDPAARMKLRVYLASPQKFDEAIEFGFPSVRDQVAARGSRARPTAKAAESLGRTFYDDVEEQTPSLSDGDDGDLDANDSPRTPSALSYGLSQNSSLDRASYRPKLTRDFLDPYVHASSTNREMTLHMTLTRPDLRSPDEVLSTRLINSVPLEQPPLIFPDSPASFWDSLPDDESKMKKIWRRLRLRG